MAKSVTAFAPAKLNLYLHVLGKRDDGYHMLDSLVVFANTGDIIEATDAPELSLDIRGPFAGPLSQSCPDPEANLVIRAAQMLADELDRPADVALRLTKNLPVASGIGGGSSDAAATLRALAKLWSVEDKDLLENIAGRLGADVPICLHAKSAYIGGAGEEITPLPHFPEVPVVLANPGDSVSTPEVFAAFGATYSGVARFEANPDSVSDLAALLATRHNDLMRAAMQQVPDIRDVQGLMAMQKGCLLSRMSGSGATCYGLFDIESHARRAQGEMRELREDWWITAGFAGGAYLEPPPPEDDDDEDDED